MQCTDRLYCTRRRFVPQECTAEVNCTLCRCNRLRSSEIQQRYAQQGNFYDAVNSYIFTQKTGMFYALEKSSNYAQHDNVYDAVNSIIVWSTAMFYAV